MELDFEDEYFDCCSRFSSSQSTPCSSVSSSETVEYHPELFDDEYMICYTVDELNAKADAKQRHEEVQRSLAIFLLDTLKMARNLEELSSVELFADRVYDRINLMGGDSSMLEGMISPLFQFYYLAQSNNYPYVWQSVEEVEDLEALTEIERALCNRVKELHVQAEQSQAKIKQWEEKICAGKLALMNIWAQINHAMHDIIVGNEVYKEADFAKLCLSKFYDHAEEDLERFRDENGYWYVALIHLHCRKKCLEEEISHDKDMLMLEFRDLRYLRQLERGHNIAVTMITLAKSRLQLEVARGRYVKEIESFITKEYGINIQVPLQKQH